MVAFIADSYLDVPLHCSKCKQKEKEKLTININQLTLSECAGGNGYVHIADA
jgi:hypothetical protein